MARKKIRGEKEKERKGDEKEKARLAYRDQLGANARRDRSAAEKQADANRRQREFHKKVAGMHKDVPPMIAIGTDEDVLKDLL